MNSNKKIIEGNINTTEEFLSGRNLTLGDVKEHAEFLISLFGEKFEELFTLEITSNDIDYITSTASLLKSIKLLDGFDRHIALYNTVEFKSHLYTAQVAKFLVTLGYKVILEPIMESESGPHPDLKIEHNRKTCFVECKTSEIQKFYDRDLKKSVADLIYDRIQTCDQINLTYTDAISLEELELLINKELIQAVYSAKFWFQGQREARWKLNSKVEILVIFQPAIIGAESDFPSVEIGGILVNNSTKTKSIGIQFLKGGRSIGVYEVVDFKRKLKNQRIKSTNQLIENYPNITFIKDANVLGDAETNMRYLEKTWLTKSNELCSGIVFFDTYNDVTQSGLDHTYRYVPNQHAKYEFKIK